MAYPAQLDALPTDSGDKTDAKSGTPTGGAAGYHAGLHNSAAAAINSIEAILGLNPQGGSATVSDRIAAGAAALLAETARAEGAEATKATKAALEVLNLGSDWSAGDLIGARTAPPPAAHKLDLRDGTLASPVKIGTTASISRTDATTRAEVNAMGPTGTDGPDGATAFRSSIKGAAGSQVQILAGAFTAWHTGESNGGEASADAGALYGFSRVTGAGVGRAIPLYLESSRETATSGGQQGIEIRMKNSSGSSDAYVFNGASKSMGIWINPQSAGEADSAAGIQFGHGFGRQFDVGIGFNSLSIKTATIRDDSNSLRGILIKGAHEKAAIAVGSGAGPVLIGVEEATAASALLEVFGPEAGADPLIMAGSGKGANYSIELRNSTGQQKIFVANGASFGLTGTAQGDTGINFTPEKAFHIGRQTKRGLMRFSEGGIGIGEAAADSFGGGKGVVFLANAGTVPTTNPTAGGILYCEAGKLMYRGSSGTVKELATA